MADALGGRGSSFDAAARLNRAILASFARYTRELARSAQVPSADAGDRAAVPPARGQRRPRDPGRRRSPSR
jgi:hypothetical protein